MPQFIDSAKISGVKRTSEGYLIADAFAVRTGIQRYAGAEVGRPDLAVVNVYRPESEVFKRDSVRSFSHVPVTNDHPSVAVDANNWRDYAVGETSDEVMRDGERLRIPLVVKDASAIADIEGGKRELSAGYACDLEFESGITADGQVYDAVQRNIRANHVAIVQRGRAGSEFRIGDGAAVWGAAPISDRESPTMNLRTIMVDGISIQTTDQGVQAIEKLEAKLAALTSDTAASIAAHKASVEAKDAEIGQLKVELKQAKDAVPDASTLDKMVADRVALVDTARRVVADIKVEGLTDAEVRKAVVAAKLGDDMVKDAGDAEIVGMFKAVTKDAPASTAQQGQRPGLILAADKGATVKDNGQGAYEKRLTDAWKGAVA